MLALGEDLTDVTCDTVLSTLQEISWPADLSFLGFSTTEMRDTSAKMEGKLGKSVVESSFQVLRDIDTGYLNGLGIEESINRIALHIASTITPGNEHFVVMKIIEKDVYKITYAEPADSERHAVGQLGHLKKPVDKKALLKAIDEQEVVIVQDANNDPLVAYMGSHVANKKINSLAIIPVTTRALNYLIVMDKIGKEARGFDDYETTFLHECRKRINSRIENYNMYTAANGQDVYNFLSGLQDILRNHLQIAGGRINRILKSSTDVNEIRRNAEVALSSIELLDMEIEKLMKYMTYIKANDLESQVQRRPVEDYLRGLLKDENLRIKITDTVKQTMTELPFKSVSFLLSEVHNYAIKNGKKERAVEIEDTDGKLTFTVRSSGFQPFKKDRDAILCMIQALTKVLMGNLHIGEYMCRIELPIKLM